jgi:uncharacterized membrane protein
MTGVAEPAAGGRERKPALAPTSVILAAWLLIAGAILFLWYAPASYQVYLALHIVAIVVWVGGDVTLTTLGIVFERRGDGEILAALGRMGEWIGTRIYTPTLFAAFGLGVVLVEKGNWGWNTFWIDFAVTGWGIAAAVGVAFVGPEFGRIDKAARTHGPDSAEVARRVKRLFTVFRFDTALLLLIVIDMVAKPSF